MSNIFRMMAEGYQNMNEKKESDLKEKLEKETDLEKRKRIERKIEDAQYMQGEEQEPQEESLADAYAKNMEQKQKNDEFRKSIKREALDSRGRRVEVDKNNHTK